MLYYVWEDGEYASELEYCSSYYRGDMPKEVEVPEGEDPDEFFELYFQEVDLGTSTDRKTKF